jgi:hypothetical protein
MMQPITREDFDGVVERAIPPASQPDPEEKQTSAH